MPTDEELEIAREMLKCKSDVYNNLAEIKREVHDLRVKQDIYDGHHVEIKRELRKHEFQRTQFNKRVTDTLDDVVGEVQALKKWAINHDKTEMGKYDEIIVSNAKINKALGVIIKTLDEVKDDTEKNTSTIDTVKKYWGRILFIGTGAMSTIAAIYWLYGFLEKHGMVIVFEKGVQQ